MMNKRNTEGFALAYVTIVIVVLCALTVGLMSLTLDALQAQERSVQRMQDKYEAQGEVERLVAELQTYCRNFNHVSFKDFDDPPTADEATNGFVLAVNSFFSNINTISPDINVTVEADSLSNYVSEINGNYFIDFETQRLDAQVSATIELVADGDFYSSDDYQISNPAHQDWLNSDRTEQEPPQELTRYEYQLTGASFSFVSYEITSNGGDR